MTTAFTFCFVPTFHKKCQTCKLCCSASTNKVKGNVWIQPRTTSPEVMCNAPEIDLSNEGFFERWWSNMNLSDRLSWRQNYLRPFGWCFVSVSWQRGGISPSCSHAASWSRHPGLSTAAHRHRRPSPWRSVAAAGHIRAPRRGAWTAAVDTSRWGEWNRLKFKKKGKGVRKGNKLQPPHISEILFSVLVNVFVFLAHFRLDCY